MGFSGSTVASLFLGSCCSVAQSCPTLCNPMDCSTPGFPVLYHLRKLAQIHVHWVSDAIQPSHLLLSPSSPTFSLSQHQGLFQWVSSSHQVAKIFLEVAGLILFELNCLPSTINSRVEVVTPSKSECDFNWKLGHFRYYQLVDEATDAVWLCPY